ncbi:MFS transporter [Actinacidiphila paucisporea]|uniref:Major Facilitator Superfamily protein n=1 Tax=Actinacidiphila paucisporea TaxID=310782 RepID=A0A1M7PG32_9ACTN|nr:MFS transporter [Actinacidiphila paucisporea]SHN15991.1 Major Facilitator Superfamily protein [Actinacidiphila paucisporea]
MTDEGKIGVFDTLKSTPTAVRYLLGGVLINQLGAFVQTFLVLYLTHRHMSVQAAGLSLVAYSAGTILGTMLGSEITQRFGPRFTIVAAMAGSGPLVAVIPAFSRSGLLVPLLLVVGLAGLLGQAYRPAASVLLSDLLPERHQVMGFSMFRIALNTGAAVAPLIAAGLILLDWDALFWLDGATALAYAGLAFALLPRQAAPAAATEAADAGEEDADAPAPITGRAAYAAILRDRKYLLFLGSVMLGTLAYMQSVVALPLQIRADAYPTALYSVVLTVSSVVLITCELKVTTYILRIPTHTAVLVGHLVNALGFVGYALSAHSPVYLVAGAVLEVAGVMIAGPSMYAHPATFPAALKARYIGVMQAATGLAAALGPLITVYVWTRLDHGFWMLCALAAAVTGVLAMAGTNRDEERGRAAAHEETAEGKAEETVGGTA